MIRMKALQAFKDMEGDLVAGAHFLVNEERALALRLSGKAEHAADQTDTDKSIIPPSEIAKIDEPAAEDTSRPSYAVPRAPE